MHVMCCAVMSSHTVCVVCRLETANLRLQGELERAPGWEEVHRCTHTHTCTHTSTHTHTHAHIPAHTHISHIAFATVPGEICAHDLVLLPCQPNSRDAAIKALELDLAAAPKQERMDQLVWAHWSMR